MSHLFPCLGQVASVLNVVICLAIPIQVGSRQELGEHLKSIAVIDREYELGDEVELVFARNQAARLRCAGNPYGLQEVLIGWISGDYFKQDADLVDVRFVSDDGKVSGGNSSFPGSQGCLRQFGQTPCLVVAEYGLRDGDLAVRFRLQTDPVENRRAYQEFRKRGSISTQQRGPWEVLTGTDWIPVPELTAAERVAAFTKLWSEVKYNFAFFDQVPHLDWDQVLSEYIPAVMEDQTTGEFYRLMQRCLARLQDGHTKVKYAWRTGRPALLVRPVAGRAIIADHGLTEEITKSELKRGDEITHVDGRSVQEILKQDIYPYVSESTPQGRDSEAYRVLLGGPEGTVVGVRVRSSSGSTRDLSLTRRSEWKQRKQMPWLRIPKFEHKELAGGIAYVSIRTFGTDKVVEQFNEVFEKIRASRGLIIDVRGNGGGSTINAYGIVSYLTDGPLEGSRWRTRKYMPAFRAWGQEEEWHEGEHDRVEPGDSPYLGPLVVLIGPETVSAAEDFLIPLHHSGRATLVGERTAGTTGQPLIVRLPVAKAWICTKRDSYPDGREFVGVGVIPDVEVHATQQDIASGRDAVLERALEVIRAGFAGKGETR